MILTKKELLLSPDYTHVSVNGRKLIKHGNFLHPGNYSMDRGIDINDLKSTDIIIKIDY